MTPLTVPQPPATGINFSSWFLVGWLFQYFIRRNYFEFWKHSNYVLSAALSAGSSVSLIISTALQIPNKPSLASNAFNGDNQWWGNTIDSTTLQGSSKLAMKTIPERGFAPAPNGLWLSDPISSSSSSS